jgi:hypothetical protein
MDLRRTAPTRLAVAFSTLLVMMAASARRTAAQEDPHLRIGVSLVGTALVSLVLEHLNDDVGIEVSVGTWSFKDLSTSAVVRGYLGASALRPVVGGGFWIIIAAPEEASRWGTALVARFPIGFDWRTAPGHFVDLDFNVNRALLVRRRDDELRPMNERLVPIPGLSYRWAP